jgi:hypothetical protein
MPILLTTHIKALRERIAEAEWQDEPADCLRLQLALAVEAHERGEVWHVPF